MCVSYLCVCLCSVCFVLGNCLLNVFAICGGEMTILSLKVIVLLCFVG